MTYIPSIRNKYQDKMFKGTSGSSDEREKNSYWQGYLPEKEATYLRGYDHAVETAVDTFFANLDVYDEELLESGFNIRKLDDAVMCGEKGYGAYTDDELNAMTDETRTMLALRTALCDFLEGSRDEWGVAMLDALAGDTVQEQRERAIDAGKAEPAKFASDANILPDDASEGVDA